MSPRFDSPPASPDSFSRPRPRPPRSPAQSAQIRVRNRRREYLERNPVYFKSSEHEFADPLLYDSLIRRFQTPAEREEEGRERGYARVLEGSLMRGEERLAKLAAENPSSDGAESRAWEGRLSSFTGAAASDTRTGFWGSNAVESSQPSQPSQPTASSPQGLAAPVTALEADILMATPATSKEEGIEQWETFLRERFVRGGDEDFEYAQVDHEDAYDVMEQREQELAWFEDEEPEWASDGDSPGNEGKAEGKGDVKGQSRAERILEGETGIQDF